MTCHKTIITERPVRRGETYPLNDVIVKGGQIMKKDYHTCNTKVLCDECKKRGREWKQNL